MSQRILVPLDGSVRAEYALPIAARIARASGGSLHLLEVVSPPH
jgi:nucleotide-binding universal stress UspA family protein